MLIRPVAGLGNGLLRSVARPLVEESPAPRAPPCGLPPTNVNRPRCGSRRSQPGIAPPFSGSSKLGLSSTARGTGSSRLERRRRRPSNWFRMACPTAGSNDTFDVATCCTPATTSVRASHGASFSVAVPLGSSATERRSTASRMPVGVPLKESMTRQGAVQALATTTRSPSDPMAALTIRGTSAASTRGIGWGSID